MQFIFNPYEFVSILNKYEIETFKKKEEDLFLKEDISLEMTSFFFFFFQLYRKNLLCATSFLRVWSIIF